MKLFHQLIKKYYGKNKSHIVQGIKGYGAYKSKFVIVSLFRKKLSGLYVRQIKPGILKTPMSALELGTFYYSSGRSGTILNDILRRVSADKALGPD
jgi:hypothetical protein